MTTITQTITTLPTAPDPATMTPTEFSTAAAAYVLAQKAMVPELNTWAGQVNTVGGEVNTNATTATTQASNASASASAAASSAAIAAALSNLVGEWSSLSGAKTTPLSVTHDGAFWALLENTADVTADEPGVSSKWARAYGIGQIYERASNIELTAEDSGKIFKYTSGTFSQTFDAAASLGANWYGYFWNPGTGIITFNPDGSELIDGAATKILRKDCIVMVLCDGSAFTTIEFALPVSDQHVIVTTGNSNGGTNTSIRRFTTTLSSAGNAITYADSAGNGGSFTINEAGLYEVSYIDGGNASDAIFRHGISVNSAELSTAIDSITNANRLGMSVSYSPSAVVCSCVCVTHRFAAGDVVRAHTGTNAPNNTTAAGTRFSIRKVAP